MLTRLIVLVVLIVVVAALDLRRLRAGRPTFSTIIRGLSEREPAIPWAFGVVMVLGNLALNWPHYDLQTLNAHIGAGLMWGLFTHLFTYKH
jgi:hypothetical protein